MLKAFLLLMSLVLHSVRLLYVVNGRETRQRIHQAEIVLGSFLLDLYAVLTFQQGVLTKHMYMNR